MMGLELAKRRLISGMEEEYGWAVSGDVGWTAMEIQDIISPRPSWSL
jgi:hypothetical protein